MKIKKIEQLESELILESIEKDRPVITNMFLILKINELIDGYNTIADELNKRRC